jgi:hypothetical protein
VFGRPFAWSEDLSGPEVPLQPSPVSPSIDRRAALAQVATVTPFEAGVSFACAFVTALADHLGRTYEEVEQLLAGTPYNLWGLVESPQGWTALGLLLSPPDQQHRIITPTIQ